MRDILFPLIGVIIGGLISYLSTSRLQARRWEREKKYKLAEKRREAVSLALEWLAPIERAWNSAFMISSSFARGDISEKEFRERWPDLLSELAKRDLPASLNILLPEGIRHRGFRVLRQLDAFKFDSFSLGPADCGSVLEKIDKVVQRQEIIRQEMRLLEKELVDAYSGTFE